MNALWQDSGVAGRDEVREREQGVCAVDRPRPRHRRPASSHPAQVLRQDNTARLRHSRRRLAGIAAGADHGACQTNRSTQSNYYGSPAFDYDHADQNTVLARVEHNLTPRWTVSNQTRYNRTEREAVISTVQIGRVVRAGDRDW